MQGSRVLGLKAQEGVSSPWSAQQALATRLSFLCVPSSPFFSTHKTWEPIKGAGKIMNKPGKHEINTKRQKYGCH